jgi:amino acid adenylation domain-containing protein
VRIAVTGALDRVEWPEGILRIPVNAPGKGAAEDEIDSRPAATDLAYVIFTSGSTGLPKGVMIDHRGAVNTIADINRRFSVGPDDRVLALSSLSFDLSVWDLFGILAAGGTVVMPSPAAAPDPQGWAQLITEHRVTIWNSVPALMEMLVATVASTGQRLSPSLRLALLSGDWIPVGLPDRLRAVAEGVEVVSLGGATEASIWSILHPIGTVDPAWKSIPYGYPMANQTFHVLDERLEPCPDWVAGNLYIGGVGLAQGYWRDQAKTAASFFRHPRTGELLYRTGDLGRWLPSGEIEFLGREDFQVKIQGYRIELGEIEVALYQHPGVREAVVTALGEAGSSRRLVAYVVCKDLGHSPTVHDLRVFLAGKLPEYMVPPVFVFLEALPLTENGKVDRRALPAPSGTRPLLGGALRASRNPVEEKLVKIWEEVLGVQPVGTEDDFFELGGDSLLALNLVAAIERSFGCTLGLAPLFENATVTGLVPLLEAAEKRTAP